MAQNFSACDREQELLLPPSLREWLPRDHLAWFVLDAVEAMDLSGFLAGYCDDGWGRATHDPAMMVALLVYAYAIGERSSRRIERRCPRAAARVAATTPGGAARMTTLTHPPSSGPRAAVTGERLMPRGRPRDRAGQAGVAPSRRSRRAAALARRGATVSAARDRPVLPGRGVAAARRPAATRVRASPGRSPRARREPASAAPPSCVATARRAG
jgi:hypothetical protein